MRAMIIVLIEQWLGNLKSPAFFACFSAHILTYCKAVLNKPEEVKQH